MASPTVDIHTHIYPSSYIRLLSARSSTPYIYAPADPAECPRLIILPTDDSPSLPPSSRGRPIDGTYTSAAAKVAFMDQHGISASVLSLANPWLDWLDPSSGDPAAVARDINDDLNAVCALHPGRLWCFATLPLSARPESIVAEIRRVKGLPFVRGVIVGTSGVGDGLDDARMDPLWEALEQEGLPVFVHPHYGLPSEVFGPRREESGHVLPLSLGFPLETTIAFFRMYLAGVFSRFGGLKVLLAHAGGAVPFLAGRVQSCVRHERSSLPALARAGGERESVWNVLDKNVWLDGVVYSAAGLRAATEAVGKDKVLWGTDHPFFPPVDGKGEGEWESVRTNVDAVREAFRDDENGARGVLGMNAIRLLGLKLGPGEGGTLE
jgi:aminocarboxymuconate-semialdehyde decarboxylase